MALTLEEARAFNGKLDLYKETKRRILGKWNANCSVLLSADALKDGWPEELSGMLQPAFDFLQEHGAINFGVAQRPPEPELEPAAAAAEVAAEEEGAPKKPSKAEIVERLYAVLRVADFTVMTEKKIRAQLEGELGCDMAPYRALVRKHVMYVLENQGERDSLEPLSDDEEDGGKDGERGGAGEALKGRKGDKAGKKQPQQPPAKETPHVVVVGAGLAGLSAANMLQRNGIKVTLLEAQQLVGGRIAKLFAPGPAAAGDEAIGDAATAAGEPAGFGAVSLLLPLVEPDEGAPAAVWPAGATALHTLCRQLGITPLRLSDDGGGSGGGAAAATFQRLQLYGTATGGGREDAQGTAEAVARLLVVGRDVQDEAEGLLAELLEDVRQRLDEQDEDSGTKPRPSSSLASEIEAALARLVGPSVGAAEGGTCAKQQQQEQPQLDAEASGGAGSKRPAGASDDSVLELSTVKVAKEDDRPAKRSRAAVVHEGAEADVEGTANNLNDEAGSDKAGAGQTADMDVAEGREEATENGGSKSQQMDIDGDTERSPPPSPPPPPPPPAAADDAAGKEMAGEALTPAGRRVSQDALRVLRAHLLPLLELQLAAPLDAVAACQLRLLPPRLPGLGRQLTKQAGAAESAGAPLGLLPVDGAQRMVEALAAALTDMRTGVVVTGVLVTASGVKVSTVSAGTITAAAAVLAVPHAVLQSGAISLDPAPPSYRTTSSGRVAGGCAVSLSLELPAGTDLVAVCGGELRPFMVGAGAPTDAAGAAAEPAAGRSGLGFVFCPCSAGTSGGGGARLVAHVDAAAAQQALALSDEDLQRHAMSALRAAATAAGGAGGDGGGPGASAAAMIPDQPVSCHVTRWGGPSSSAPSAPSSASGRAAAAAAAASRGGACCHLAPLGLLRDMQLLGAPIKGRLFFAGEHTAPDQLPSGLMSCLVASGLREGARVLRALRAPTGKAAAKAGPALEVGDEQPLEGLVAAANAAAAAAEAAAAAVARAAKGSKAVGAGKPAAGEDKDKAKPKGRSAQVVSDSDSEDDEGSSAAAKRRKQEKGGAAGKDKGGKAGKRSVRSIVEELEDDDDGSGGSEQEEDMEDEDVEDEEEDEPKAKKSKAQGKGRKQQQGRTAAKAKREGGSEAEKRKRKRAGGSSDSDDEGGADDSGGEDEGEGGKRPKGGRRGEREREREKERMEDPVQQGILEKQRKQQALAKLQADRKDLKVVYKAMMAAGSGNLGPLREQMSSCAGLDAKQVMLQALQGATLPVLQLLANDGQVLTWLHDWLLEMCDEPSAEHLILSELRLLERLPLLADGLAAAMAHAAAAAAAEGEAGAAGGEGEGEAGVAPAAAPPVRLLLMAVRERCGSHRSKDVKRMAAQVAAAWERRAATAGTTGRSAHHAGGSAHKSLPGGGVGASRPPVFNPRNLVSLRTTPPPAAALRGTPPPPPPPPGGPAIATGTATASSGAPGGRAAGAWPHRHTASGDNGAGAPPPPPPTPPPPEGNGGGEGASGVAPEGISANLDPELEARLLAAKAAAEAARQEAALAAQRRAEVQQEAQTGGGGRNISLQEIATFEDFKRFERSGTGSGGTGGKHKDKDGGGKHHKSSSSSAGGAVDLEALKGEVVEYTKQLLKRHHKAGKITTSGYRLILDKATRKVFETLSASSSGGHGGGSDGKRDLLGSKRREKIGKLVEQYVQKMELQAGGGGLQPERDGARGDGTAPPGLA